MWETLLTDFDTQFSTIISDEFLIADHPHGALDILWRKALGEKCNIVDLDDGRLLGIEVDIKNNDDEIKKQFKFLYHDEFSIQKAKETLKKIDEILVVPNLNNISNIKNIYNFTIRDLEEILKQTQINMILKKTQALKF